MTSSCPYLQKIGDIYTCNSSLLSEPVTLAWTDVSLVCEVEETYITNICQRFIPPVSSTPQDPEEAHSEEKSGTLPSTHDVFFPTPQETEINDIFSPETIHTPISQKARQEDTLRPSSKPKGAYDPSSPQCTFLSSSDGQLWCNSTLIKERILLQNLDAAFICQVPIWSQNVCGRLPDLFPPIEEKLSIDMGSKDLKTTETPSGEIEETGETPSELDPVSPSVQASESDSSSDVIEPFVSLIDMEFVDISPEELEERKRKHQIAEKRAVITSPAFSGFFDKLSAALPTQESTKQLNQKEPVIQEEIVPQETPIIQKGSLIEKEDVFKEGGVVEISLSSPMKETGSEKTPLHEPEISTFLSRDFVSLVGGIASLKSDADEIQMEEAHDVMSHATSVLESALDERMVKEDFSILSETREGSREGLEGTEKILADLPQIEVISATADERDSIESLMGSSTEDRLTQQSFPKSLTYVESVLDDSIPDEKEGLVESAPVFTIYESERGLVGKLKSLVALADEAAEKEPVEFTELINISKAVKSAEIGLSRLEEQEGMSVEEISLLKEGEKGLIIRLGYGTIQKRLIKVPQTIALLSEASLREFENKLQSSDSIGRFREQRDLDFLANEKSRKFFPLEFWYIPTEGIQSVVAAFVDPIHSIIVDTWPLELISCYEIVDLGKRCSHFLVIFRDLVSLGHSIARYLPLRNGKTLQIAFGSSSVHQNFVVLGCSYDAGPHALINDCLTEESRFKVIKHRASSFGVQQSSIIHAVELQEDYTYSWEDLSEKILKEFPNIFS